MNSMVMNRTKLKLSVWVIVHNLATIFFTIATGFLVYSYLQNESPMRFAMAAVTGIGAIESIIFCSRHCVRGWMLDRFPEKVEPNLVGWAIFFILASIVLTIATGFLIYSYHLNGNPLHFAMAPVTGISAIEFATYYSRYCTMRWMLNDFKKEKD